MSKKLISIIMIIGSILLIVLSLTADLIGIGSYPGINYAQLIGAGVGLAGLAAGIWLRAAKSKQ